MKDSWSKYLSKGDLVYLMEIANGCLDCVNLDSLSDLLLKLKKIAGFDAVVCTCAEPSSLPASLDKTMRPLNYKCQEYTMDKSRFDRCYKIVVPVQMILSTLNLGDISDSIGRFGDGRLQIVIPQSNTHRLSDGWVYGAYEKCCNRWILFVFARRRHLDDQRPGVVIELIIPHLIHAFRGFRYLCSAQPFHLTKREYEVLNWVKKGKTTWEIAQILAVSESCINFHIDNLKKKLNAVTRGHAIAIALGNGLIKI